MTRRATSFLFDRSLLFGRGLVACALAAALLFTGVAPAQLVRDSLPELEGVGIVDKKGAQIPPGLTFKDSTGRDVRFEEFFDGERPVLLVMAYYRCPLLCTLVLNQVQRVLNEMKWTAGDQFRIVTVSFDHASTTEQANAKHQLYLSGYGRDVPPSAWPFLTGDAENIRALANGVGYHYKFLPETGEFAHPAALIILTPTGTVHNYIEKLGFVSGEVQLALGEARAGTAGTIFDRVVNFCFSYNHETGRYTANAMNLMRVGASASAVALGTFIGVVAWRGRTARRALIAAMSSTANQPPPPR